MHIVVCRLVGLKLGLICAIYLCIIRDLIFNAESSLFLCFCFEILFVLTTRLNVIIAVYWQMYDHFQVESSFVLFFFKRDDYNSRRGC